ncbi:helix-turn-helix transcriptional regulator [Actinophytocola algeriensis]|uniref:Putative DNA-binding transcriptional regulator YafY n=1 Tax=Actinophytocola algeriensis TaxID=1768010 RepID=A0A7W7QC15_9PSEU|nr:YafY family protein [Actinophytocola algeriensis]MBB4910881.1 putative DNA-binding transcriptional regulator YafY [Actinophytocola algeriensis]MBE1473874.1 putative DNA-binding transcriptional regulator YafY [Actinophytocola algeriensis]
MTRPTARVLALLELLQNGGTHTVSTLAGRLGVDERTLRRYAQHLTDLGIPIESRRGRYGGYRLMPGYKLPPLMLTDDEAVAVVLGLVAGRRAGLVTAAGAAVDSASAKVRRVLPEALGRRLDALLSSAAFTAPAWQTSPPGTAVLLVLADAARRHQPVAITYTSWRGSASERRVEPYGLVFHSGRWYVTGLDSLRGEVRTFRLDRIAAAELVPGSFEVPADFDPTARVLAGLADVAYPYEASVLLLGTTVAEVREKLPAGVATLTGTEDGVRLLLRANRLEWVAGVLAWLGCDFAIEYPDELRAEVVRLAERLTEGAHSSR